LTQPFVWDKPSYFCVGVSYFGRPGAWAVLTMYFDSAHHFITHSNPPFTADTYRLDRVAPQARGGRGAKFGWEGSAAFFLLLGR